MAAGKDFDGGEQGNPDKLWRESSYDFWTDAEKMECGRRKQLGGVNGDGSSKDDNGDAFDFVQGKQGVEDPPSRLIGQFLHKQKASGEVFLDFDLEMPESEESPSEVGSRVSMEQPVHSQPSSARRRQFRDSPAKESSSGESDEVVSCTSNKSFQRSDGSFQRKSVLLKMKTKSRFMAPVEPKSGFLGKNAEEEEDDPLFEEDLPEEFKKDKLSAWVLLEWVSLIVIIGALICSLSIPYLRGRRLWKLMLWNWEILVLVLICGRLVSRWIIRIVVFFIERNFLLRKRVVYFVYGLRKSVQNCLWLALFLIAWHFLFEEKLERETKRRFLRYVTKVLVCLVVCMMLWLVKTLVVKVLSSSFHVSTYFDRIQDSLFNQYVIETLSGPPFQKEEEEEKRFMDEVNNLQKAGATVPQGLKTSVCLSPRRVIGSGLLQKSPKLSRVQSKENEEKEGITIDSLHKMNPKNVSAWSMKRLMSIIRHGSLSALDEQIHESSYGDESATQIKTEYEAKLIARRIFQNVARPGAKYIFLEDVERFMRDDETEKTMSLFEGPPKSKRISKKALKNWVVNAFRERRALALSLKDTKTAVNRLHQFVNVLIGIIMIVIWLLILGIATTKFLLFLSSQIVLVAFIFGNTCKTVFEAIIFLFVMHPFDVGDRCEIDHVEMVVEEMNILTTVFLRYDEQKIIIPNSVLATKAISNYYRSPDMGDGIEFCIHVATPAEKIALMKQRILSYIENNKEHWYPQPMILFKDIEMLNMVRIAVWLQHRMNHQDMGEKWLRRGLLLEEIVKVIKELDIQYHMNPLEINVGSMPTSSYVCVR